jgi:hypothetical protein
VRLDVHVDETAAGHDHAGLVCGNLIVVGRAAYGLQHPIPQIHRKDITGNVMP